MVTDTDTVTVELLGREHEVPVTATLQAIETMFDAPDGDIGRTATPEQDVVEVEDVLLTSDGHTDASTIYDRIQDTRRDIADEVEDRFGHVVKAELFHDDLHVFIEMPTGADIGVYLDELTEYTGGSVRDHWLSYEPEPGTLFVAIEGVE